jgi:hypothetical protein
MRCSIDEDDDPLFLITFRVGVAQAGHKYYPTLAAVAAGADGVVITQGHASFESAVNYAKRLLRINQRRLEQGKVIPFASSHAALADEWREEITSAAVEKAKEKFMAELSQRRLMQ